MKSKMMAILVFLAVFIFLFGCAEDAIEFGGSDGDVDDEKDVERNREIVQLEGSSNTGGNPAIITVGFDIGITGAEAVWQGSAVAFNRVRLETGDNEEAEKFEDHGDLIEVALDSVPTKALRMEVPESVHFSRFVFDIDEDGDDAGLLLNIANKGKAVQWRIPIGLPFLLDEQETPWKGGMHNYLIHLPLSRWLDNLEDMTKEPDFSSLYPDILLYRDTNGNGKVDDGEMTESHIVGRIDFAYEPPVPCPYQFNISLTGQPGEGFLKLDPFAMTCRERSRDGEEPGVFFQCSENEDKATMEAVGQWLIQSAAVISDLDVHFGDPDKVEYFLEIEPGSGKGKFRASLLYVIEGESGGTDRIINASMIVTVDCNGGLVLIRELKLNDLSR